MLPLTRSRNRARFFGIPFSPSSLFAAGEQGAWYDPSDYSTLFTTSAGTTPVSAPGNGSDVFVGLMLDKSKGLVLGSNIIADSGFDNPSYWTAGAGWTVTGGKAVKTAGSATGISRANMLTIGKWYKQTVTVTVNAGGVYITSGPTPGLSSILVTTSGTYTTYFLADSTTITAGFSDVPFAGSVDDFSVRELPGNHAFQTSSAKRPKLAARYNLLTYSEEFDNGAWTKTNLNTTGTPAWVNVAVAPDGTTTAERFIEDTGTVSPTAVQLINFAFSATQSYYVKPNGRTWVYLQTTYSASIPVANRRVWFNLSGAGSVGTIGSEYSNPTIVALNNGWYRISAAINPAASGTSGTNTVIGISNADNSASYTGDGTSGIYIWGADLRPASQATGLIGPTYQRVAAANVYDTAGFLPYLVFDGLDWHMTMDSLVSGTSYFEGANAPFTMFAGARRNTTGSFMSIVCLCDNTNATPSNNDQINFQFRDATTQMQGQVRDFVPPSTFNDKNVVAGTNAAPQTNVLTWNRTATNGVARVDGVAGTPADQTQPALGLALATIGALRRGTTPDIASYLNGWLYSLIVRGAQSTQSQIEATEAWVAGKTGVSI